MHQKNRKKIAVPMILAGIVSVGLYAALLTHQDILNDSFSRGGIFALLPIATAFVFSFVHGSFTGHFWTFLGIEASKKKLEVK
jgi:hypothetical protein